MTRALVNLLSRRCSFFVSLQFEDFVLEAPIQPRRANAKAELPEKGASKHLNSALQNKEAASALKSTAPASIMNARLR